MQGTEDSSSMRAAWIQELRRSSAFCKAHPLEKIARSPRRILFARWASWRNRTSGATYPVRARLFWGDELDVVLPDPVSAMLYAYGHYEPDVSEFLLRFLEPGSTAFDVGAHFGYYSLLMSALVGPEGVVHAFEPTPRTHAVLSANVSSRPNIRANHAAVWSEDTTLELSDFGSKLATFNTVINARMDLAMVEQSQPQAFQVSAVALDSYLESTGGRVDFLKIDAENAESEVLRGMSRIIADHRPVYSLEVGDLGSDSGGRTRKLLEEGAANGYEVVELGRGTAARHELRDRYHYGNVLMVPGERVEEVLGLWSDG